jgi:hypothetical protein
VEQLSKAVHNWSSHTFKIAFSNSATVSTNTVLANITQISAANGYTSGGPTLDTVTLSETSGTAKVTIADEVFTASGGNVGPMRYFTYYNDTATSPADALCFWYDYGSALTLADTETLTFDHDASNGIWQLA